MGAFETQITHVAPLICMTPMGDSAGNGAIHLVDIRDGSTVHSVLVPTGNPAAHVTSSSHRPDPIPGHGARYHLDDSLHRVVRRAVREPVGPRHPGRLRGFARPAVHRGNNFPSMVGVGSAINPLTFQLPARWITTSEFPSL